MPWQRQVADVAFEVMPDGSWAYRTICVTVQRQAGKTTFTGPAALHRILTVPKAKAWLTAQHREDARATWKGLADLVKASPLAAIADVRRSNGGESLAIPRLGGAYGVFAPSDDALHGTTNQLVTVDEAWAFDLAQGTALDQAILPTFTTTGGQLCLVSTAGSIESAWFRSYVDRGRAAAAAGRRSGICYFEWSLPDDCVDEVSAGLGAIGTDTTEELQTRALDLILAHHPAHGYTVRRDALQEPAEKMGRDEFLRAFGNRWSYAVASAIPSHLWSAGRRPIDRPSPGALGLGFDTALDRSDAAIGAAWHDGRGGISVDVIERRDGAGWLPSVVREVGAKWQAPASYDASGPVMEAADDLRRDPGRPPVQVISTNSKEFATACATVLGLITDGRLSHAGNAYLDAAVANAATRPLGDGFVWARRKSGASIAALNAVTEAVHALLNAPQPMPRPYVGTLNR